MSDFSQSQHEAVLNSLYHAQDKIRELESKISNMQAQRKSTLRRAADHDKAMQLAAAYHEAMRQIAECRIVINDKNEIIEIVEAQGSMWKGGAGHFASLTITRMEALRRKIGLKKKGGGHPSPSSPTASVLSLKLNPS